MIRDISHAAQTLWAARTVGGMVLIDLVQEEPLTPAEADLVTLRNDSGDVIAARMIGPVAGGGQEPSVWKLDRVITIDPRGIPLSSIVSSGPAPGATDDRSHDWGALGLPSGLDTCVSLIDTATQRDDLATARESAGHRHGEASLFLSLAPGETVRFDETLGVVIAVDRRKRTVEIERGGDVRTVAFDDVNPEEKT